MRIASLSLLALCLTLAALPATAQVYYSNGPTNGNTDAWTINFGYIVSDTFNVTGSSANLTGAQFAMWLFSGDTLSSAELSITSGENSGTTYYNQTVSFTQSGCTLNSYGFNVCDESTTNFSTTLNAGTYWLNLQNASVPSGDPVYWDENSGPSSASENTVGSIPSESFTLLGSSSTTTSTSTSTSTTTTSTVPEPSSIMLFGSGILGLAGVLRRKLF
jgi:hypothetical protein